MAYLDEIDVGDEVTVTDLRDGEKHKGIVLAVLPGGTKKTPDPSEDRVLVQYDHNSVVVRVAPNFVTLEEGE